MKTEEILPVERHELPSDPGEVHQLLRLALEKNVPVETIEKLTHLAERLADRRAAQEFNAALAEFQRECPAIEKTTESGQFSTVTRDGVKKVTRYAELDQIARTIGPHLHKRGLSYTWDSSMTDAGKLVCVCILRHENGHESRASFTAPTGSNAGASEIQKHAAALTYARRQSLVQVLGLTCCDPDTDGADQDSHGQEKVTEDQVAHLENLIEEVGANHALLLKFLRAKLGVERLEQIPARRYEEVVAAIETKRRKP